MNTLAWVLILTGMWVIRAAAKGRSITETWDDTGDMFIALVQNDSKKMKEILGQKGSGLDFEVISDTGVGLAVGGSVADTGVVSSSILALGKHAQKMGLSVREHPAFDKVDPVHTKNSDHYRNTTGTGGDAIDVSGDNAKMIEFATLAKSAGYYVLFNRPGFTNWPGHDSHVHVSDRRNR